MRTLRKTKKMCCRLSGVVEIVFSTKFFENAFFGVAPDFPRSEITIIESVSLRRIFFIFDQNWESLGIRVISEKLAIFARMSVTKVRFYTRRCALLELLLKLKHFSKKLRTHFNMLQFDENQKRKRQR